MHINFYEVTLFSFKIADLCKTVLQFCVAKVTFVVFLN